MAGYGSRLELSVNPFEGGITDEGLKHFKSLTRLESLGLRGTEISDAGLRHLESLTQLRSLDLTDTHVTDEGIAKLQQALPNCKITH